MVLCGVMIVVLCFLTFFRHMASIVIVRQLGIDNAMVRATLIDVDKYLKDYKRKHTKNSDGGNSENQKINFKELYPFPVDEANSKQSNSKQSKTFSLYQWNNMAKASLSKRWERQSTIIPLKSNFIEISKAYNLMTDWNLTAPQAYNAVIEMPDCKNYWITLSPRNHALAIKNAALLNDFNNYLKKNNIHFMYIQQPSKVSKVWDKNIDGITDFKNETADIFLDELKKYDVPFIDLRDEFNKLTREEYHNLFFNTDHHWKPDTARQAAKLVFQQLNRCYDFNIDTSCIDKEKFTEEIYENHFLGSQGKKVTLTLAKPDDFSLYYPKDKYKIHYVIPDLSIDKTGNMEIMYEMSILDEGIYNRNDYGIYGYSDRPLIQIENESANNNHRLLLIKDSFTNAEAIFMSLAVRRIDIIDPRDFDGSIRTFIEKEKPDMVIVQYYTNYGEKQFSLK